MFRGIFKALIYIAGICFVGSFILTQFPGTRDVWETVKVQGSHFYSQLVAKYGLLGALIIIACAIFMFSGKKR